MATVAERVQAGVAWLTEKDAEWWKNINTETLDLSNPKNCILGQWLGFSGLYNDTRDALGLSEEVCQAFGFQREVRGKHSSLKEYKSLTCEWRKVLKMLKKQG